MPAAFPPILATLLLWNSILIFIYKQTLLSYAVLRDLTRLVCLMQRANTLALRTCFASFFPSLYCDLPSTLAFLHLSFPCVKIICLQLRLDREEHILLGIKLG